MNIAYIVGPYRAETYQRRQENIAKAAIVAKEYWKQGYAVICPHTNSANFDEVASDKVFLNGYLEILFQLHHFPDTLVVALPGWKSSSGSRDEITLAEDVGIEIYYLTEEEYATFTN